MNDYGFLKALHGCLSDYGELSSALKGIYTYVPEDVTPPYLTIQVTKIEDKTLLPTRPRLKVTADLTLISQYLGSVELQGLMGGLSRYLKNTQLQLSWEGKSTACCVRELSQNAALQADTVTRKGVITVDSLIQF